MARRDLGSPASLVSAASAVRVTLAVLIGALAGCTGDEPQPPHRSGGPVVVADDAYPVINTFLLALEAKDAVSMARTVQTDAQIDGIPRADAVAAELAAHGGLPIDYFTITTVIGEDVPDVGEFRAKVGDPDRDVTLSWWIAWQDGQWRVHLPPRLLSPARIG